MLFYIKKVLFYKHSPNLIFLINHKIIKKNYTALTEILTTES